MKQLTSIFILTLSLISTQLELCFAVPTVGPTQTLRPNGFSSQERSEIKAQATAIFLDYAGDVSQSDLDAFSDFMEQVFVLWPDLDKLESIAAASNEPKAIFWILPLIILITVIDMAAEPAIAPIAPPKTCERNDVPPEALDPLFDKELSPEQKCSLLKSLIKAYPEACFDDLVKVLGCVFDA